MNEKYEILEMHICAFEKTENGILKTDLNEYPKRLCVLDKNNKIVIDVLTLHKYEYIKTINTRYFVDDFKKEKMILGRRFACFKNEISLFNFDSKIIKLCDEIIKSLDKGVIFKDGNEELTNYEYLNLINSKIMKFKTQKIYTKRK